MLTNNFNRYSFEELAKKAFGEDAQQIDIDTLGAWCGTYMRSNGECFDVSLPGEPTGTRSLFPVYSYNDETDDCSIIGYELR